MSIKQKLIMSFSSITLLLIGLAIFSNVQLTNIDEDYTFLLDERAYKVIEVSKVQNATSIQGLSLRSYLLRQDKSDVNTIQEQQQVVMTTLKDIQHLFTNPEMAKEMENVQQQYTKYIAHVEEIIALADKGALKDAENMLFNTAYPVYNSMQQSLNRIAAFQKEQMTITSNETTEAVNVSKTLLIVLSVVGTIIAIFITYKMVVNITKPLRRLTQSAQVIAAGDLRQQNIEVNTKDEIHDLAEAFNTMKSNLHEVIANVSMNVSNTTAAAEQLAASTDEVSVTTKDIAVRIDEIASNGVQAAQMGNDCAIATDESAQGVSRIAEAAQQLNERAIKMEEVAATGARTLQTAETQMSVIQQSSHETKARIQQLSTQSAEIESITKVITDITDQTNLLALNAAIEAARAGEHGKGFAVVADEVRKLAEQSKQSAGQIVELTSLIQKDTKAVEESVDVTVSNIDEGVMYVQHAQTSFNHIVTSVSNMAAQIQEVSASAEEMSASTEEVAASVQEMAQAATNAANASAAIAAASEEQTATMSEINSVARTLTDGAQRVQEQLTRFNV